MPRRPTLSEELSVGIRLVVKELVPPVQSREPVKWTNLHRSFVYLVPFLFMAYLVRRANTYVIRLLLLPTIITSTIWCTYHYRINDPRCLVLEWLRSLVALYVIGKSLNFAFTPHGRLKLREGKLPEINHPDHPSSTSRGEDSHAHQSILPGWLSDALEIIFSLRGIGWDFGQAVYVPPSPRSSDRVPFLRATAVSFIKNFLVTDLCDSLLKLVPGVGTPGGGSMFIPELPWYARYTLSTAIHVCGGMLIICGLEAANDFAALIGVGILNQSPEEWLPLYGDPWRATSLHEFWGKAWHQTLRHVFLVYGGYPGHWLAGRVGMVFGTFLASGIFHEIALQSSDHRVTLFFLLQAVGVTLESVFAQITGRRVGGALGWVWTAFFVLVLGQMCVDSWTIGGIAGAILVPKRLSLVRCVLFPSLRYILRPSR